MIKKRKEKNIHHYHHQNNYGPTTTTAVSAISMPTLQKLPPLHTIVALPPLPILTITAVIPLPTTTKAIQTPHYELTRSTPFSYGSSKSFFFFFSFIHLPFCSLKDCSLICVFSHGSSRNFFCLFIFLPLQRCIWLFIQFPFAVQIIILFICRFSSCSLMIIYLFISLPQFQKFKKDFRKRVFAVAMTDSVHFIHSPSEFKELVKVRG